MFEADSRFVDEVRPGLGVRRGELDTRPRPICAVVVHTMGAGVVQRIVADKFAAWRAKHPEIKTPLQAGLWVYHHAMLDSGHYTIGQDGSIAQVVPEDLVARHVGGRDSRAYSRDDWDRDEHAWWRERWPTYSSPVELAGGMLWAGGSCNDGSVGVEVEPPIDDPTGPWSDAAWRSLSSLVGDIVIRHDVAATKDRIPSHSDTHPRSRTSRGRPYDPGPRQWSWGEFAQRSGAPF